LEEIHAKQTIISFVQAQEQCFERSLDIGHITASSWLLSTDKTKALLMHHRKLDMWVQLGGHCDGDPDVLAVAIKEAQEESGIQDVRALSSGIFDIDVHRIPENKKEKAHYHYDVRFLLHAWADDSFVQNNESKDLRWFSQDEPLPTRERSVVRMYEKWLQLSV
jgi:8-oxo-dGTP pyrophosphatase MutT (NUDIX family)